MVNMENQNNRYFFTNSMRILDNGKDEVRLRTGVWNYEEAILDLSQQSDNFKRLIREIFQNLQSEKGVDDNFLSNVHGTQDEKSNLIEIVKALKDAGYVENEQDLNLAKQTMKAIFGGTSFLAPGCEASGANHKPSLLISDSEYTYKYAKELGEDIELSIERVGKEDFDLLASSNLTANLNAFEITKDLDQLKNSFSAYSCVLGCFVKTPVQLLRNINRIITELKMPFVLAFFDGPFVNFLCVEPPKTGCFECFEMRLLSRLEDHVAYHDFVKSGVCTGGNEKGLLPVINILTNLLVTEAFMINNVGSSRFSGRALSIYLPNLEIQVQNLLRIPFCPACGAVAKSKFEEINLSTRRIVDDIISPVLHANCANSD